MDAINELALHRECPRCFAPPEFWCTTASGARARWLHQSRLDDVGEAWQLGYRQGFHNARDGIVDSLQRVRQGERWALRSGVPLADIAIIEWIKDVGKGWLG